MELLILSNKLSKIKHRIFKKCEFHIEYIQIKSNPNNYKLNIGIERHNNILHSPGERQQYKLQKVNNFYKLSNSKKFNVGTAYSNDITYFEVDIPNETKDIGEFEFIISYSYPECSL